MLNYLKFFPFTKHTNTPKKHLVINTVYGSPLQKQRSVIQTHPQFKNSTISIQTLNPENRLLGLKKQQPVLSDQLNDKLFIMYSSTISDTDKQIIEMHAQSKETQMVTCAPKKPISCLKVSNPTGPAYYLVRLEDIKALQVEPSLASSHVIPDAVATRLVR